MYQVIEFYRQNLQLARETGDKRGELSALNSLGRAYQALEEHDKALECYESALIVARDVGDGRSERQTMKYINDVSLPPVEKNENQPQTTPSQKRAKRTGVAEAKAADKKSSKQQPGKKTRSASKKQITSNKS